MKYNGKLTNSEIARIIGKAGTETERAGIEEKLVLAFRLTLEEVLLKYKEQLGEGLPFTIRFWKRRGNLSILLTVAGESFNPFEEENEVLGRLPENFRNTPEWSYEQKQNRIRFFFTLYNTTWRNIRFSWKYTVNSRRTMALSVCSQFISAGLSVLAPIVSSRIIVAYTKDEGERVLLIALALLGVQLLRNLFLVLGNQGYNKAYCETLSLLEKDLVVNVMQVESQCMDEKGSGLFIQRITTDTQRIASGFTNIADMITQVLNYVGVLCALFVIHPLMALFVVVIVGAQYAMEVWRTKRLYKDDRVYRSANERFSGLVGEMVRGAKDVKLLNSEDRFIEELDECIKDANQKRLSMQTRSWRAKLFRWEFGEAGTFALIALLSWLIATGKLLPSTA
ncbi:MAG: ABC transporter ATP-binding protein, partial [Clostridia bacterium]|nr:ABC transporter ATP-binding protein [Clostridia bacterium]